MSMTSRYRRLSAGELDALLNRPHTLLDILYPEDDAEYTFGRYLDIGKSWHAIHFLLNHDPWGGEYPHSDAVLGGTAVSDEDLGYGPARYLPPDKVREVAGALALVPRERLLKRFEAKRFEAAEIYPHGWAGVPEEREDIAENYRHLVQFFREAASKGEAILLWLA